jgi:bifunctional non-homologous end joining protein LigD
MMPAAAPVPELIRPMLAAAGALPSGGGWAFEFKYDGVRAVSYVGDGPVRVMSRNDREVTATYPELAELGDLLTGRRAVLDGEIVALEPGERPSFAKLAARMHVAQPTTALLHTVPVVYYVFDVLWLDGTPLLDQPYQRRRELLAGLPLGGTTIRTAPSFTGDGAAVLRAAELGGLEGVVAKRLTAAYRPGSRSPEAWTKVPLIRTQEVVVLGWKPGEGRRSGTIGSLLLGVYDRSGALHYAGGVGTGFTDVMLTQLQHQLTAIGRRTPPAAVPREFARHARWVEPEVIGEVAFRNWTPDGRMRHPSWRGLRADRRPADARYDFPAPAPPPQARVKGVMATRDREWRIEVVERGGVESVRVVHGGNVIEGLSPDAATAVLHEAGVDLRQLDEIDPAA